MDTYGHIYMYIHMYVSIAVICRVLSFTCSECVAA